MNTKEVKFSGFRINGFLMLLFILLLVGGVAFAFWSGWIAAGLGGVLCFILAVSGFMIIEPNNTRVMVFFGKYKGTLKETGFFWVNPFYVKRTVTQRARNLDIAPIKVNDKAGNPIMIGLMLVWRVADTYKAMFEIDSSSFSSAPVDANVFGGTSISGLMKSFQSFVRVQSDAALREVAGKYAYDNNEIGECETTTLRSGGETINAHLEKELNDRLRMAGIEVLEARINYLAYAPEIAAVMLRRQQAAAIISAREKIVEGAVGMVQMALKKLSSEQIIELDEDKKAAMVSNLLVVLCADEAAHPVVNTGTLHQ